MNLSRAAVLMLAFNAVGSTANSDYEHGDITKMYRAVLSQMNSSGVQGYAVVMAVSDSMLVYTTSANGLPINLALDGCEGTVSCGNHIRSGDNCTDFGGYYLGENAGQEWLNPWLNIGLKYRTGNTGVAFAGGLVQTGKTDTLEGRPFVMFDPNGAPVSCGILQAIGETFPEVKILSAETSELANSGADGEVHLVVPGAPGNSGQACLFGKIIGLEPNLLSRRHFGGDNCTAVNGCGTQVYGGSSCEEGAQGNHFYSAGLQNDPWRSVSYGITSSEGVTFFASCTNPGITNWTDYSGKPVIIHSDNGTMIACGLLAREQQEETGAPSGIMAAHMTAAVSLALGALASAAAAFF